MDSSYTHELGHATTSNNSSGMDLLGIGNAVSGIASAIGTVAAAKQNRKAQQETNAANLALAQQQNQWNLDQWNRENAYNSPANQVSLLQQAGLNPLFYGSSLGPNEASSIQSADLANQVAPQLDAGAIGSSLGTLTGSLFNAAQVEIANKKIENERIRLQIERDRLEADKPNIKSQEQEHTESAKLLAKKQNEVDKNVQYLDELINNAKKDGKIKDEEAKRLEAVQKEIAASIVLLQEKVNSEKAQQLLNKCLAGKASAETKTLDATREATVKKLEAEVKLTNQEATKVFKEISLVMAQRDKAKAEKELVELQTKYLEKYGDVEHVARIFSIVCGGLKDLAVGANEAVEAGVGIGTRGASKVIGGSSSSGASGTARGDSRYHPYQSGQFNTPSHQTTNPDWWYN